MCGWAGVFGVPVTSAQLASAGALLATRGPDDAGQRTLTGPLPGGLTHRRLAIIDPSPGGHQPMRDDDRDVTVVYNGELYNSPALRTELQRAGVAFRSGSDTEVLLRAWIHWGDAMLERLEGIFSFALVDERAGRVLLARDRLGVKPLYWARRGDALVAGSAPRALLALAPELREPIDSVALAQFLTLLWIPHPRTPWRDVHKLAPGTAVAFDGHHLRSWPYWQPPDSRGAALDPIALRDAIRDATHKQLLADVPVGVLFSGGLDSTLLLELMADEVAGARIHARTAGYDAHSQHLELVPDDLVYARQVAAANSRVDLAEVQIAGDAEDALAGVDALAHHFDDPVADPAALTLWQLCRARGPKVVLSGVGGEELFAGYPRHLALPTGRRAAALPAPVRRSATAVARWLYGGRPGPAHAARRNAQKLARVLADDRAPHYWRMMSQLTFAELERLVPGQAPLAHDELDALSTPLADTTLADALAFDRAQFLPNLNLAYVDKASMADGVEVRVPLLDESVVELTCAARAEGLISGRVTKAPLRAAARGVVAPAIVDRDKTGFGGPVRRWFQGDTAGVLAERIDAVADAGLVTRQEARRIYADASTGRQDVALAAWALVCLGAWHHAHGPARGSR